MSDSATGVLLDPAGNVDGELVAGETGGVDLVVTGRRSIRLWDISERVEVRRGSRQTHHRGQVPETFNSHGSTHSG